MIKVKVLTKNKQFAVSPAFLAPAYAFTQDSACDDYDWLVVFDEPPLKDEGTYKNGMELLRCPRERTILATWEPVSIKNYCTAYTRQFGHLLTNRPQTAENHPHYHQGQGYFPWYNGRTYDENKTFAIPPKTEVLSAICSAKAMKWSNHHARIELLKRVVKEIPGAVWYGHGVHEFAKKYDAMDAYRYHLVLENHTGSRYWTEKIVDAYLCECLPFYAGAPDLYEDFPRDSYIPIPIDDPKKAIAIMKDAIANDEWSKRIGAIREAKARLFEKYNFWSQVIALIEAEQDQPIAATNKAEYLYSRKYIRKHTLSAKLEDGWFHLRQYLSGVGLWKKF